MATLLIEQVKVTTMEGYPATITGIDPFNHDLLAGTVETPSGRIQVTWNASGVCRGKTNSCNLKPKDDAVRDVIETAQRLGSGREQ